MDSEVVGPDSAAPPLAALVDGFSRRVYGAVLEQHRGGSVSSPLGVWLLLAACVSGARDDVRAALETALGCTANDAEKALHAFMLSPPPALRAAIAVWVAVADARPELAQWVRSLPDAVQSGFMPTKAEADAWAEKNTLGLINSFPAEIDATTRIVLASALATRVSWPAPFEVVPAAEHLGDASPWPGLVERLLWDSHPGGRAMIAETQAAGLVAVHLAVAKEDVTVISVSAEYGVARDAVLEAAHEVAACVRDERSVPTRSLFDLPLGGAHSWEITENEIPTYQAGQRVERVAGVSLPAWSVEGRLELQASQAFGCEPALQTMGELIGSDADQTDAVQVAVASFTRYGFEAAAITALARASGAIREPAELGTERSASLRFDHPYAAIAIVGRPTPLRSGLMAGPRTPFTGLPVFAAWVHEPTEADDGPP